MGTVWGFSLKAPNYVYRKLRIAAKPLKKRVAFVLDIQIRHTEHVLLFASMREYLLYTRQFGEQATAVIFDSPFILFSYSDLEVLDIKLDKKLDMKATLEKGWRSKILTPTAAPAQPKFTARNFIRELIAINSEGRFLNTYNEFMYSTPKADVRAKYKANLINYLFGVLTPTGFVEAIERLKLRRNSKSFVAFEKVQAYMKTPAGITLRILCKQIRKKKTPNYTRIAKLNNIDSYEIRYLHKAFLDLKVPPK